MSKWLRGFTASCGACKTACKELLALGALSHNSSFQVLGSRCAWLVSVNLVVVGPTGTIARSKLLKLM